MNLLLLEQHSRTINTKLQEQSANDVNNSFSTSSLVLKIKRQKHEHQLDRTSFMAHEDQHQQQRLKRTNPISSIRRPSSPAFNGKQQQQQQQSTTKRSVIIDNNNNNLTSNSDENSSTIKRFKQDHFNVSRCLLILLTSDDEIRTEREKENIQ